MIANEVGDEFRRLHGTGIGGDEVNPVGRLVKALAGFVDGLGLSLDLGADGTFDDVSDDGAGMGVRSRCFSGAIADFHQNRLEVVAG